MLSVLITDEAGRKDWIEQALDTMSRISSIAEIIVLSDEAPATSAPTVQWIDTSRSAVDAMKSAMSIIASKRVVIVNSSINADHATWAAFMSECETAPQTRQLIAPIASSSEIAQFKIPSGEALIQHISKNPIWPVMAVGTTRAALNQALGHTQNSINEVVCAALILAASEGNDVSPASSTLATRGDSLINALFTFDNATYGRLLKITADSFNIEELFPNHAWREFSKESAAAAYHSLAALFLRFGDVESANQCLACSESLEESPRYFALKGLIQRERGETLGAVANMVSSLQCYESRKRNDGNHYLSFKPDNLEMINSRLVDGLEALNKRDNIKALENFAEAVFQFDPFYTELGVIQRR